MGIEELFQPDFYPWIRIEPKNKNQCNDILCYYCRFRQYGQLRINCYKYQEFNIDEKC
jgi:hypothetical protein